jgi:hypothetical protein
VPTQNQYDADMSAQPQPPIPLLRKRSKPWKEVGYRGFSAFLASDNDFLIFRRFGSVNARLLLYLQDEIAVLEKDLEDLEDVHARDSADDIHNGSFRQDVLPARTRLLESLNVKVRQYSKSSPVLIRTTTYSPHPHQTTS